MLLKNGEKWDTFIIFRGLDPNLYLEVLKLNWGLNVSVTALFVLVGEL